MASTKELEELVSEGRLWIDKSGLKPVYRPFISFFTGKVHFNDTPAENLANVQSFAAKENAVMIVAYPKTGSHLMMSIVDQLGKLDFETYATYYVKFYHLRFRLFGPIFPPEDYQYNFEGVKRLEELETGDRKFTAWPYEFQATTETIAKISDAGVSDDARSKIL